MSGAAPGPKSGPNRSDYAPLIDSDAGEHHRNSVESPRRATNGSSLPTSPRRSTSRGISVAGRSLSRAGTANGDVLEVHFASVDQKRRKWWKDAGITGLFIGSWLVECLFEWYIVEELIPICIQVFIRHYPIRVQQVDVLTQIPWLSVSSLRYDTSYGRTRYSCFHCSMSLARTVQTRAQPKQRGLFVSSSSGAVYAVLILTFFPGRKPLQQLRQLHSTSVYRISASS